MIVRCLLFFVSFSCFSQRNLPVFYNSLTLDKVFTETEYITFRTKLSENVKKYNPNDEIKEIIIDELIQNDSIIKSFVIEFITKNEDVVSEFVNIGINSFIGKKLPENEFEALNDNKVSLVDYEGKPTLINIWFSKCKPCVAEIPILNKIRKGFTNKINFLAITPDKEEEIIRFFEAKRFDFIHLFNASDYLRSIGVEGYPVTILIDKNGIVSSIEDGLAGLNENGDIVTSDGNDLIVKLSKLLKE